MIRLQEQAAPVWPKGEPNTAYAKYFVVYLRPDHPRRKSIFPRKIYFPTQNLLSDAEMAKDIVEGFLGSDLTACDVG